MRLGFEVRVFGLGFVLAFKVIVSVLVWGKGLSLECVTGLCWLTRSPNSKSKATFDNQQNCCYRCLSSFTDNVTTGVIELK